jgi:hypothetical protein
VAEALRAVEEMAADEGLLGGCGFGEGGHRATFCVDCSWRRLGAI